MMMRVPGSGTAPTTRVAAAAAVGLCLLFATACATSDDGDGHGGAGSVQVLAAASLNNAGEELAEAFAEENDGAEIVYNYAGSSALVRQVEQGADADLFISADEQNMDAALELDAFDGADPDYLEVIATNQLVLATAPGNPLNITSLADLDELNTVDAGRIAVCADGVPCGTLANQLIEDHGYDLGNWTVSEEANVSDVATKVSTGEVDAGFMYSTDANAMASNRPLGDEEGIGVIQPDLDPNRYPAALTVDGRNNDTARAFLEWLSSDTAREILESYGFGTA